MVVRRGRTARRLAAGLLCLLLGSCSKSGTSPNAVCDNEGGDLVAFASDRGHAGQYSIYLFDADGQAFRALRNLNQTGASYTSPALSRDGQLIAFVSGPVGGNTDIQVYERLSCGIISAPGLATGSPESDPEFSGSSSRLAFTRDTLGHRRIRLVNASAGSVTYVPLPGLDDSAAAYDDWDPSPDQTGARLAFVSDREGSPHLYLYSLGTGKVDSLLDLRSTDALAQDLDPALTPDAGELAFASNRPGGRGGFDLYLVDLSAATRQPVALLSVNTAGNERCPAVGLDPDYLAFESDSTASGSGRDVRYVSVASGSVIAPTALIGTTSDDAHPSARLP
jgi:Tol biopolymer transport system component